MIKIITYIATKMQLFSIDEVIIGIFKSIHNMSAENSHCNIFFYYRVLIVLNFILENL